jgi:hypothetical protein
MEENVIRDAVTYSVHARRKCEVFDNQIRAQRDVINNLKPGEFLVSASKSDLRMCIH